jgi:hypothetical protein
MKNKVYVCSYAVSAVATVLSYAWFRHLAQRPQLDGEEFLILGLHLVLLTILSGVIGVSRGRRRITVGQTVAWILWLLAVCVIVSLFLGLFSGGWSDFFRTMAFSGGLLVVIPGIALFFCTVTSHSIPSRYL